MWRLARNVGAAVGREVAGKCAVFLGLEGASALGLKEETSFGRCTVGAVNLGEPEGRDDFVEGRAKFAKS